MYLFDTDAMIALHADGTRLLMTRHRDVAIMGNGARFERPVNRDGMEVGAWRTVRSRRMVSAALADFLDAVADAEPIIVANRDSAAIIRVGEE